MLLNRNLFTVTTVLLMSVSSARAEHASSVMPVSASFGAEQSMMHKRSDNSGRQIAMAPAKLPKAEVASDVATSKQVAEFSDAVNVTARRLTKEGSKQFAQFSRWIALLWKQQTSPPRMTPASGPAFTSAPDGLHSYKGQPMRAVTPKHPLWLLTDGRVKTVTSH